MKTTATNSLTEAWAARSWRAQATLQHVEAAPALFKPERVQELRDEGAKANAQYRYWLREGMGR